MSPISSKNKILLKFVYLPSIEEAEFYSPSISPFSTDAGYSYSDISIGLQSATSSQLQRVHEGMKRNPVSVHFAPMTVIYGNLISAKSPSNDPINRLTKPVIYH